MKQLILAFSHFDTGGLQTLMVRMAQWGIKNNINCLLIFETCDDNMIELCKKANIAFLQSFDPKIIKTKIEEILEECNDVTIITFELPEFLFFEKIRLKYFRKNPLRHLIYNVSVNGMIYGKNFKGFCGKVIYQYYRKIVKKYFDNNQVIFMDDETCASALNYYKIDCDDYKKYVYLLPMFISNEPDYKVNLVQEKIILTVTRAKFPYKGYVIGLIDDFCKIFQENSNIRLKIISFGEDYEQIVKKIGNCTKEIRQNIELVNGMSLTEIREELKKAYCYIGMGTTILDAADEGIPALVTWHSTMENICSGFFHDNPRVVARFGQGVSGELLLKEVISLSKKKYIEVRKRTYVEYRKHYDINVIVPQILNRKVSQDKVILNSMELLCHTIIFKIRQLRRKALKLK